MRRGTRTQEELSAAEHTASSLTDHMLGTAYQCKYLPHDVSFDRKKLKSNPQPKEAEKTSTKSTSGSSGRELG